MFDTNLNISVASCLSVLWMVKTTHYPKIKNLWQTKVVKHTHTQTKVVSSTPHHGRSQTHMCISRDRHWLNSSMSMKLPYKWPQRPPSNYKITFWRK